MIILLLVKSIFFKCCYFSVPFECHMRHMSHMSHTMSYEPYHIIHGSLNVPIFHITQPLGIWSFLWLL